MRIEIEIPKEYEGDYNKDKFDEFFGRVLCDIADGTMCGRYEKETAQMLLHAFAESKPAYDVEAVVAELEKRANDNDRCADRLSGIDSKKKIASWRARAEAFRDAAEIVRGKDKCSTCQYSSGHVSTCMLKSSVCYYERRIVRGKE